MIDRFMLEVGIIRPDGDLDDAARARLVDEAEIFLRAGGALTLGEWTVLSAASRAAFGVAFTRLEVDRATLAALAGQGPESMARVRSAMDGGEALADVLLAAVTEKAAAKIGKKP